MDVVDGIEEVLLRYEDPGEFLLGELQELCENDELSTHCDVQIRCKDKVVVKAHSSILAIVSPFLKTLLSETWDPHHGADIILPDFW